MGPDGVERPVQMGSYGIGPTRVVASIIEASHDDAGVIWPESVAPFHVALLNLKAGDSAVDAACGELHLALEQAGFEVLHDDRDERPGAKFATADLIGLPYQVIVGPKGLAEGKAEIKWRKSGARETVALGDVVARLKA
jgi:prolyl-tRNA synthetase